MSIGMEIRMRAYIYCQQQFKSEKGRSILKVQDNNYFWFIFFPEGNYPCERFMCNYKA